MNTPHTKQRKMRRNNSKKRIGIELLKNIYRKYLTGESTIKQLAAKLGVTHRTLYYWLEEAFGEGFASGERHLFRYLLNEYKGETPAKRKALEEIRAWMENMTDDQLIEYACNPHNKVYWYTNKTFEKTIGNSKFDCREYIATKENSEGSNIDEGEFVYYDEETAEFNDLLYGVDVYNLEWLDEEVE